jgi:hypothetical protein
MEGLMACETTNPEQEGQNFYFFSTNQMEKFLQLIGKYTQAGKVNAQQFSELKAVFNELPEDEKAAAQESLDTMESVVEKTDEEKAEEARVLAEKEAEQKRVQDEEAEKARKEAEGNEGNEEDKEKK